MAMRRSVGLIVCGLLLANLPAGCHPSEPLKRSLVLSGSHSMVPLMTAVGRRFEESHPDVRVNVEAVPGERILSDTRQGLADLGMLGRALRPEETGLHAFPIAKDGLALIVHRDNPIPQLNADQVAGVFTRAYQNWREVRGSDNPILPVSQGEGRGAREAFLRHFGLEARQVRADPAVSGSEQVIDAVATHPNAIGYASLPAVQQAGNKPIRVVPLGGVTPTLENIANRRYLLVRPLQLLTREAPQGLIREFLDFVRSAEVHDLIEKHGFVPASP
jgi:phosphate transport system substrate-binding protein